MAPTAVAYNEHLQPPAADPPQPLSAPASRTPVVLACAVSWVAAVSCCVAIAIWSGAAVPQLRTVVPYLGWLLLAPAVGWWAHRVPPRGVRHLALHGLACLVAVALHQATFRLLYYALTGVVELPTRAYLFTALWVGALLYVSTVWPVFALGRLARAQEAELRVAEQESGALAATLDRSLARLGPHELDDLLGRVRLLVASSATAADGALDALGRYLRFGLRGVESTRWTWRHELELAAAYLDFEAACSGRRLELAARQLEAVELDRTVRQHTLVDALAELLAVGGEALRLELAAYGERLTLGAFAPGQEGALHSVEVGR